jgi:hypothetical protein
MHRGKLSEKFRDDVLLGARRQVRETANMEE